MDNRRTRNIYFLNSFYNQYNKLNVMLSTLMLFVLAFHSCIYSVSSQGDTENKRSYNTITLEEIDLMPCHEPGEELDTGVRGRPDYTIDWYLCKQKAGAEVYRGACSKCKCQWTLYYEIAKRCFPENFGSERFAVYQARVEKQKDEWIEMGKRFCDGEAPEERYTLNENDPMFNNPYPYCAPAAHAAFQLQFIIGFPAIMMFWLGFLF